MDSGNRKKQLSGLWWLTASTVAIIAGCQLIVPQNGWNEKEWGPLVPHTRFPGDCSLCHLPERWDKLRDDFSFDHEKETGYALEGAHSQAACLRCHNDRGPVTTYLSRGCAGCHQDPHAATLGIGCESCHSELSWAPIGLVAEHAATRFPLMGAHAIAACESCHEGAAAGQFRGAPTQCEICHQADLAQATDPNHIANGWIADCQQCHQPGAWEGAFISHDFFPLNGGHALDCSQCHTVAGTFTGLSTDCYTCHSPEYQSASGHASNNYSHNCLQCHNLSGWDSVRFDHSFFPLTGAHNSLDCQQCHGGGVYAGLPQDCYACHTADYQSAPNHVSGTYPLGCEQCHATTAWRPASFDHSFFALTGGHAGLDCVQCHAGGVYTGLSPDCYSCHTADYQTAPNHVAGGYATDCLECHTTAHWTPATFDHSFFTLTGGHSGLDCTQCHSGGIYAGLSTDCYSCHTSDYQSAPDHAVLGFPHNCTDCHTIAGWRPANFSHNFPLSGNHNTSCTTCHDSGSTQLFTCFNCHTHSQSNTDSHHSGVSGYSYNSQACYDCHPNGRH